MPIDKKTIINAIISVTVAAWFASYFVGFLHGTGVMESLGGEHLHPLIHTTRDWLLVLIVALPVTAVVSAAISIKQR